MKKQNNSNDPEILKRRLDIIRREEINKFYKFKQNLLSTSGFMS